MNESVCAGCVYALSIVTSRIDSIGYFLSMLGDFRKADVNLTSEGSTQIRGHSEKDDGCDGLYVTRQSTNGKQGKA